MSRYKIQVTKQTVLKKVTVKTHTVNADVVTYMGIRIKSLRRARKLTQEEFGDKIGLTRTSVINIEAGRHSTTFTGFEKICKALNCKSSDILPF